MIEFASRHDDWLELNEYGRVIGMHRIRKPPRFPGLRLDRVDDPESVRDDCRSGRETPATSSCHVFQLRTARGALLRWLKPVYGSSPGE
jgi:hypothetical protein